jgi:hypothetical protein
MIKCHWVIKRLIVGEFKIAIDEADGFLVNKKIFLEDKLLGKTQDLSLPYNLLKKGLSMIVLY